MSLRVVREVEPPKSALAFVRWLAARELRAQDSLVFYFTGQLCGFFDGPYHPRDAMGHCEITVACRHQTEDEILLTIGHEFAHYAQWRDGRKITEIGVEARGARYVAEWREECGHS